MNKSFNQIYAEAKDLCQANNINLSEQYRSRRPTAVPNRFQDCFIDSTLGHRAEISSSSDILNQIYLPLIDCILVEIERSIFLQNVILIEKYFHCLSRK